MRTGQPTRLGTNKGFTLVELAIVLVIIGLIIGGVLAGQALIRNAEMRSVFDDKERYEAAVNTFKLKYNSLPGDADNLSKYFGIEDLDPDACFAANTFGPPTCNGTGNKRIADIPRGGNPEAYEAAYVWEHLSLAELIPASLSGANGPNTPPPGATMDLEIGFNVPEAKIGSAGWFFEYLGIMSVGGSIPLFFDNANYGQALIVGTIQPLAGVGNAPMGPLFTTQETKSMDEKYDDGRPARGILKTFAPIDASDTTFGPFANDCATDSTIDAEYSDSNDLDCTLFFMMKL